MRLLLRVALAALLPGLASPALADCRPQAIALLKASAADGAAIYGQITPGFFASWIDCADAEYDLPTAVHESTHVLTEETDAFPLVGGGAVSRPHVVSAFMPPWRIAAQFHPDSFTAIYLTRGRASSATDALYLLDELNAYTHDLATAVDLRALRARDETVDHRDGLAALMAFTAAYAETARDRDAATWRGLQAEPARGTIVALWTQAERVTASSCGIPNYGALDKSYIARVCASGPRSAMAQIIGRAPACPSACLASDVADDEAALHENNAQAEAQGARDDDRVTGSLPHHPFGIMARPRHHKPTQDGP